MVFINPQCLGQCVCWGGVPSATLRIPTEMQPEIWSNLGAPYSTRLDFQSRKQSQEREILA